MSGARDSVNSGIGLGGASFLVLLVLKVMGYINMHWFWVLTSFVWVPVAMFAAVMLAMGAVMVVVAIVAGILSWVTGRGS